MSNEEQQEIAYTLEFKTKQKRPKRNVKKLLFAILLIVILGGAACALVFGIDLAKQTI